MVTNRQNFDNRRRKSRRLSKGAALFLSVALCFGTMPAWANGAEPFDESGLEANQKLSEVDNDHSSIKAEDIESNYANQEANVVESMSNTPKVNNSEGIVVFDDEEPDYSGTYNGATFKYYAASGTLTLDGTWNLRWTYLKMKFKDFTNAVPQSEIKHIEFIGEGTSLPTSVCSGYTGIETIQIPETVTSIGQSAFSGCTGLSEIDIPETVTSISANAFSGCTGITEVKIPSGVSVIPSGVFTGCTKLEEVVFPEGLTEIGVSAFSGCTALKSIGIQNCTQLSSLGDLAFRSCSNLTSIDLSNTILSSLPDSAFQSSGVTDLKFPKGLTTLGDRALNGAEDLAYVVIPSTVTSLGNGSLQTLGNNKVNVDSGIYPTVVLPYSIEFIDPNFHPGNSNIDFIVCGAPSAESTNEAVRDVEGSTHSVTYQMHHDASTDPYEVTSQDSEISFTCDTCGDEVVYTVNEYNPIAIDGQEAQAFKTAVGASGSLLSGYKVSLKDANDNAVSKLDNKLKITLPVSDAKVGENLQIYRMNDDGTAALLGAAPVSEAGLATFETDTAGGTFAVVRTTELTLTFDTVGGTSVDAESVTYNAMPSKPVTDPTRDGYTFTGWFSDAACTTAFDFTKPLTANTTVYAGWTAVKAETVSLTFDVQGGSAEAAQTIDFGTAPTKPADPTRDGYTFTGWFSDAACTTAFDFTKPLTANATVYAGWKVNEEAGGNTGDTSDGTSNNTTGNVNSVAQKTSTAASPTASASTIAKTGDNLMPIGVLLASTSLVAALAAGVALRRKQELS